MISNEKIAALAEEQARIDVARVAFLARGGGVQVLASYEFKPEPPRKAWVDPETVLKRHKPPLSRSDRIALRQLAAQL
ncbi:hypothetical protein SOM55_07440 [Pseudomonas coleopterorum]|uniref:hypothetical protein n=1 Tax=Pseudomonas coleopterorum TaxID=1605838 RepID=UPI002A6A602E|nr:hypothetical protein [Pseudomonas coleopterorum]MDY1046630.1 hypothetical protein [Pseudomonas coleopterorum]